MPSIEKFKESLANFNVDENIISQINEGFDGIVSKSAKKTKAAYFKRAVDIMTKQMDNQKLQEIFEWNACCKSGARVKASKAFAKENADDSIEVKLEKIHA